MLAEATLTVSNRRGTPRRPRRIEIGRDFFGMWTVSVFGGAHGTRCRSLSMATVEDAWVAVLGLIHGAPGSRARRAPPIVCAIPDITVSAWAAAPLLPWRDLS